MLSTLRTPQLGCTAVHSLQYLCRGVGGRSAPIIENVYLTKIINIINANVYEH